MLERTICRHTRDEKAKIQDRSFLRSCMPQGRLSEKVKSIRAAAKSPFLAGRAQDSRLKGSVCCLPQRAASREAALPLDGWGDRPYAFASVKRKRGDSLSPLVPTKLFRALTPVLLVLPCLPFTHLIAR